MTTESIHIRPMSLQDLGTVVDWAAGEGWNPGIHDAECFYHADPEGFLMAWQDGRPIGSISAVRYGDHFAFIGFFIVIPSCRGHRTGPLLAQAAQPLIAGRLTGIDGVESKVNNYHSQYGFEPAWNNIRYAGMVPAMLRRSETTIRPTATISFGELVEYDERHFLASRSGFLKCWLNRPGTVSLAALDNNHAVCGLGVARPCRNGTRIGPLFADNSLIAENLMQELLRTMRPGSEFYLDLPEPNQAAVSLAERYAMRPVFRTARMYSGNRPPIPLNRIYGITSFELG